MQSAVCCLATSRVPAARSTDRRGRSGSFDSHGEGRHAVAPGIDASKQEALRFATEIGKRLDKARKDGRFDEPVLVAAPRFLGVMRGA
ncbi:MAG: host attachment protein [Gammaproteobacteria bacterium]